MKKIVLTGGPCSGKTTTIEELGKKGFSVLEETAKNIVAERRHIPVTPEESLIRQDLIFKKQLLKEIDAEENNDKFLFLDRSLIDGLGYSILYSGEESIYKYLHIAENMDYHKIFFLELLPFTYGGYRSENEDEEESKKIQLSIWNLYKRFRHNPIYVPKMSIERRVDFILDRI